MSYVPGRAASLRSVPCPRCGAAIGRSCRNLNRPGVPAQYAHIARVYALDAPTEPMPPAALHGGRWGAR